MSVAKHIEITSESTESFDAAVRDGIKKASGSIKGIRSAWIKDQQVMVDNANVTLFRVNMKLTFVLD